MAIRHQNNRSQRNESLEPYASSTRKKNAGLCYAFKEGSCMQGDNCKFRHELKPNGVDENGDEIIYLETARLYVSNLGWNVTWQDLKGLFRREGDIAHVEVMTHPDGLSKGCGIVEYSDINSAARALSSLNGVELRGRAVYCREDREGGKPSTSGKNSGGSISGGGGQSSSVNRGPPTGRQVTSSQSGRDKGKGGEEIIYLNTPRLYVNNLAWNVTWQDLKGLFRREGFVVKAEVMMQPDGRSKGCGIIEYDDINAAARALTSLNGVELRGRAIYVREDREFDGRHGSNGNGNGSGNHGSGNHGSGNHGNGSGVTKKSNDHSNEDVVVLTSPRLFVNNLSFDVSWQDVKDLFRQEGEVRRANVMTGPDGRSLGCAIVEFMNIEGAARAVRVLHEVDFRGRALQIREDREEKHVFKN